jgi:transposase
MTLHPETIGEIPEETSRIARAAFPKGNVYMQMRDALGVMYRDEQFADLFPQCGRVAEAPWRLALVTVLQFAENLTDRQAADAVRGRIDWKYAMGLTLDDAGFDFSVLSEFRARLLAGGAEERLLDLMLNWFQERHLLKRRGRQRTDSTGVVGAIRVLNRLELVGETLRHALNELAEAAPAWLKSVMRPDWAERYVKPVSDYRLPYSEAERQTYAEIIGADGRYLLNQVYDHLTPPELRHVSAVNTLRQVWIQAFYQDENDILHWRTLGNQPPIDQCIVSPYDLTARAGVKRETTWYGYKVHLTETCDEDSPHLITQVHTTHATEPDVSCTPVIHQALAEHDRLPREHIVDAGYMASTTLVNSRVAYAIDLLGPMRPDVSWQARTGSGFDFSQFTINWATHTVTCPQGKTSWRWREGIGPNGKPHVQTQFRRVDCQACPVRTQCTRNKKARQVTFRPQPEYQALHAARQRQQTQEFKDRYAIRAGVEGTLSQAVFALGMRRTRYRSLRKVHLQHILTATAMNLLRVIHWLTGLPRSKTPVSAFAALLASP